MSHERKYNIAFLCAGVALGALLALVLSAHKGYPISYRMIEALSLENIYLAHILINIVQ